MSPKKKSEEDKLVAPAEVWARLSRPQLDRVRAVLIQIAEEMIDNQVSEGSPELTREGTADEERSFSPCP